jgi:hypothetical protein
MDEDFMLVIESVLQQINGRRHRLILLVEEDQYKLKQMLVEVSSKHEFPILNMNLLLSEELLNVPKDRRARKVGEIAEKIILQQDHEVICLCNIELLFEHSLQLNPNKLFEELSKRKTLIVGWNGKLKNSVLSFAESGHQDFRSYQDIDAIIVSDKQQEGL